MKGQQVIILMVEDDPAHAENVRSIFEGFRIDNRLIHVADGRAALNYLQQQGSRDDDQPLPNLILIALRSPGGDGLEVLRILKSSPALREIPIVVLTTSAEDKEIAQAYDLGANSFLVKPVGFKDFSEMMNALGYYWLAWNRYPR